MSVFEVTKNSKRDPQPPIETLREMLAKPHYSMVETVARCVADGRLENVLDLLGALASSDLTRAALCMGDLYSATHSNAKAWHELARASGSLPWMRAVQERLADLPVVDAHRFRVEVLGHDSVKSASKIAKVFSKEGARSTLGLRRIGADARDLRREEVGAISDFVEAAVKSDTRSVAVPSSLSARDFQLCLEFDSSVAAVHFAPENYGYSSGARSLRLDESYRHSSRLSAGERRGRVESSKEALARLASKVFVEWGISPDLPGPCGHQCVDSASAARSFFVSRGVPCDVYLLGLGSITHNVAVAFFENGERRYQPVVIDASPFAGSYSVSGQGAPTIWRPQTIADIYAVRKVSMPFAQGYFGAYAGGGGFLPWSYVEVKGVGKVIGFAGIRDEHVRIRNCMVQGTDEFYGRGERVRSPALSLTVILPSHGDDPAPSVHLLVEERKGEIRCIECSAKLPKSTIKSILKVAEDQMPRLKKTIRRLELSLGRVSV